MHYLYKTIGEMETHLGPNVLFNGEPQRFT